jgi:3-oxoadipate enol-lactonase
MMTRSVTVACQDFRMPFANIDGIRIYYRLQGLPSLPVLILSQSLGCDHGMWDVQMDALLTKFRVLRYDTRGHGASDVPGGDYALARLAQDVLDLADSLGIKQFDYCGLSLGGMTGQWLAAYAPQRLRSLILANTSAHFPDPGLMQARRRTVLESGMAAVEPAVMGRFFTAQTLAARNPAVESVRANLLATNPVGYAGCCAAIIAMDNRPLLERIKTPTLVIVGDSDVATPWEGHGEILVRDISGAKACHLHAAHLANIESPAKFARAITEFCCPGGALLGGAGPTTV